NGTILWKRKLPEGIMVHRNTLIATADTVYLADDESCKLIDAATGELRGEIRPPVDVAGGTFWKWMALQDGVLFALMGSDEQKDPEMRWRRQAHGWPWNEISEGFTQSDQPWGFGRNLLAIDPETSKVLWSYREQEPVDSRAVCMSGGRLFAFRFGAYLTCLDSKSGEVLWRKTPGGDPELFRAIGEPLPRQGWQTNWRTTAYLKCTDRALYFAGPQVGKLLALSVEDGRILWSNDYDNFQLVIRDDGLYAISGPWGNNVSQRLDLLTGEVLASLPTGRRACTRPTATSDSVLFRAMGGTVRLDAGSGRPRWISPMRPSCHDGVTVANGLLYWWPFVCDCQLTLYGLTAAGPAGELASIRPASPLETPEDAPGIPGAALLADSPADWPTFRADSRRMATSRAAVAASASRLWSTRCGGGVHGRLTAPVAAGGLVVVAGEDGAVHGLDAATGELRWTTLTGGAILVPPTFWQGRLLVGSGDGWVYALDAGSGRLRWRLRAAPLERKIPVYGKLLSTWPASSGVLVERGVGYVAAGIANYDGTYVYAFDPESGRVIWRNETSGHLDEDARTGVSVQGHLLLHGGKLYLAGGNAVSPAVYSAETGECLNDAGPLAGCESTSPRGWELYLVGARVICCGRPFTSDPEIPVYDHTVTKKLFHASTGTRDVVWVDSRSLSCFDPLDRDELSRCVTDEKVPRHITQAWGEFRTEARPRWQRKTPGGIAAAVASNAVIVASAGRVDAFALDDGRALWSEPLEAPPVEWGLAIDRDGRVIITLADGRVIAIGARS
ncbi:MAG: PQQ-binding-like beta-propeller repeat protein, partial [Planctomycetes bacterium]|nr:PQQ-binding-like beta-propeller repeat protein [Planctomycetota bacterium]